MNIKYSNRRSVHPYCWLVLYWLLFSPAILAEVTPDLTYEDPVDGLSVMNQAYFINRHFAFENLMIGTKSSPVRMLIKQGERLNTGNTLIRSLNNAPTNPAMLFQDKVHFPTGKIRGTAILVTGYRDRSAT